MKTTAVYDSDTKRFHKYRIIGEKLTGVLYFPKDSTIPDVVRVEIADNSNAEDKAEKPAV